MSGTPLQQKTIRPGSLGSYSYYHSARRPLPAVNTQIKKKTARSGLGRKVAMTLAVLAALIGLPLLRPFGGNDSAQSTEPNKLNSSGTAAVTPLQPTDQKDNHCANNQHTKFVLVSISQRHMWACQGSKQIYDTPAITGMQAFPETATPSGTFRIYAKQTDTTLTGSDSAGSWSDPVSYWLPFLNNEHGTFGFHDATWRAGSEFGTVDPSSDKASHGCVELPLAASHWLYDWSDTHTVVTVET